VGAALQVQGRGVPVAEAAGRLDDDAGAVVRPVQGGRVTFGGDGDAAPVDGDGVLVMLDVASDAAEGRVVLQQVGQGGG
jgi:hypothetical protein